MFSKRLKAVASLIDNNERVIDIGCDHGLLDIYLTKEKNVTCIASDINSNALNMAIKNIQKYNLNIKTILSDGLENIDVDEDTTIVISGMGTSTILNILENKKSLKAKKIIIQSNNNLYDLRKELTKDYKIKDEIVIYEKKKYYVILSIEKGLQKYSDFEKYIGPIILKKHHIYENYLEYLKLKEENKLKQIPKKYIFLRIKIKKIIKQLNKIKQRKLDHQHLHD